MSWGNNRNDEYGKDSLDLGSWGSTLSDGKDSPEKKQKQSEPKPQSNPGKEPERSRTPREEKPTQPDPDWRKRQGGREEKATQPDPDWRKRQGVREEKATQPDPDWRKRQGDREEKATQPDPNWRERRAEIPAELSDGSVGGGFADISAFQDAAERIGTLHSMAGKDYRVERTLSKEGGEAAILLCRDAKNERFVAKIYFYAVNDSALKAREQVLRYMSTPEGKKYTLAVCDAGLLEMAGTRYYYEITPFCPDGDLSGRGPMSFDELVSLTGYLNEALHSIHSAGILHRDIKPRNLYWNGERVLIGDFGVARLAKSGATAHTVGTEGYRAPETVLAVTGEDTAYFFDEKGDYYSLGVTLGSLFEGRFVYEGMTSAMIAAAVRNGRLPLRRQDPRREQLENLLNGLVRYDSRDRFGYEEVRAWLKNHDYAGSVRTSVDWPRPYTVLNVDYWDEQSLFEGLTKDRKHWDEGVDMLYSKYFESFFKSFQPGLARAAEQADETWRTRDKDRGLAIFLKSLFPAGPLVWKGYTFRSIGELAEKMRKTKTPAAYGEILAKGLVSHWMERTRGLTVKEETVDLTRRIEELGQSWPEEACYWFGNTFSKARTLSICSTQVSDLEGLVRVLFEDPRTFFGDDGYQFLMDRKKGAALYGFLDSLGAQELMSRAWDQAGRSDEAGKACLLFGALDQFVEKKGVDPGSLRRFFLRYGPVGIAACVKQLAEEDVYQAMDAQGRKALSAVTGFRTPKSGSVQALVQAFAPLEQAVAELRKDLTDNPFLIRAGAIEPKGLVCRNLRGCFACQIYGRPAPLAFEAMIRVGKGERT